MSRKKEVKKPVKKNKSNYQAKSDDEDMHYSNPTLVVNTPDYLENQSTEEKIETIQKIKKILEIIVSFQKEFNSSQINKEQIDKKCNQLHNIYREVYPGQDIYDCINYYEQKYYLVTVEPIIRDVFIVLKEILSNVIKYDYSIQKLNNALKNNKVYMYSLLEIPYNEQVEKKIHEIINTVCITDFTDFEKPKVTLEKIKEIKKDIRILHEQSADNKITEDKYKKSLNEKQQDIEDLKKTIDDFFDSITVKPLQPSVEDNKENPVEVDKTENTNFLKKFANIRKIYGGKRRRSTKRKTKRSKRKQKRNTKRRASHRRRR